MDSNHSSPSLPRGKQLLRSCEACRALKYKCVLGNDPSVQSCQRCARSKKECIFAEAQPRPKRNRKKISGRGPELEKKIDDIYTLLRADSRFNHTNNETDAVSAPLQQHPQRASSQCNSSTPLTCNPSETFTHDSIYNLARNSVNNRADVIEGGFISVGKAEGLLQIYRDQSCNFPFIHVPQSLANFRQEKPFLLLSVLAMALRNDRKLQESLEHKLREELSQKVIMEGQKSMDLLQGLLVYLAWYHFHFRPERQQIYQLVQLAVAMAVDLELKKPSIDSESKRTLAGCYYLSSCLTMIFRKPNGMKFSRCIEDCCLTLAERNELPFDSQLVHYVRLQRLAEEIGNTFGVGGHCEVGEAAIGLERAKLLVKAYQTQLRYLRDSFPTPHADLSSLMLAYHGTCLYAFEIGLQIEKPPQANPHNAQSSNDTWTSLAHTELILGCGEAAKVCLEYFLQLPEKEIQGFSIIDLARVTYSSIILGKLTLRGSIDHSSGMTLPSTDFLSYLGALEKRFGSLVTIDKEGDKAVWWHFEYVFKKTKAWYEQQFHNANTPFTSADGRSDPCNLSPLQLLAEDEIETQEGLVNSSMANLDLPFGSQEIPWEELLAGSPSFWDQLPTV